MYAEDTVTTNLTIWSEDLRKLAKLPKTAVLKPEVTVLQERRWRSLQY